MATMFINFLIGGSIGKKEFTAQGAKPKTTKKIKTIIISLIT
jgi:hypothetical protein